METRILPFSATAIAEAARLVLDGRPVAVPTETVYGLAADATSAEAVTAIYEAKRRPSFNPLIVHVSSLEMAERIGCLENKSEQLARTHWPGPLTLVVPLREGSGIASIVTAGLGSVALRVPAHRAMRALLEAVGRPLAAPSANASGSISATRASHVATSLGGRVPLIIDDGPCAGGIESTIVAQTDGSLRLLRRGPVEVPDAREDTGGPVEAPGQLASHYAPNKPLRIGAVEASADEFHIGFGAIAGDCSLSPAGDLSEAASRLFDLLHRADASDKGKIAVAPVPETGLGAAINDRLQRASAPR